MASRPISSVSYTHLQSISLTHLAPFVDVSRKKIAAEVELEMEGLDVSAAVSYTHLQVQKSSKASQKSA